MNNSEIMLELDDDLVRGATLTEELDRWIGNGFAGGDGGNFHAIFLHEPHKLYPDDLGSCQKDYSRAVSIVRGSKQTLALGEMMVFGFDLFGLDIINDHFADFDDEKADMLIYTAYDGPWTLWGDGSGDSDQREYWRRMQERADRRPGFPFLTLSRWYNSTMYEYADVDYLDTLLGTAKAMFNGAAAYPQEIIDEFVHTLGNICNLHDAYGAKDIWKIPSDLEPEYHKLLESNIGFGAMRRCICDRRGNYKWSSGYLVHPDPESDTDGCTPSDLLFLQKAYCELYWRRLEMFCAAAERQGLLTQQTTQLTKQVFYCAKGDCNKCIGTDPFERPDLWLTSPLPRCPDSHRKLDPE